MRFRYHELRTVSLESVVLSVPNCKLLGRRSRSEEPISRVRLDPVRASGPTGWEALAIFGEISAAHSPYRRALLIVLMSSFH